MLTIYPSSRSGRRKFVAGATQWMCISEPHSNRVYRCPIDVPPDYSESGTPFRLIMSQVGSQSSGNAGEDGVSHLFNNQPLSWYINDNRTRFNGIIGCTMGEWAVPPATDRWSVWTVYPLIMQFLFNNMNIDLRKVTRDGVSRGSLNHGTFLNRRYMTGWAGISDNDGNISTFNYDEAVHGEGATVGLTDIQAHDAWIADIVANNIKVASHKVFNDTQNSGTAYLASLNGLVPGRSTTAYSQTYIAYQLGLLGYTNYTAQECAGSHGDASRAFYDGTTTPDVISFHTSCTRTTNGVFT